MKKRLESLNNGVIRVSLRHRNISSLYYLVIYILMIFAFSVVYYTLPDRSFYHSTAKYEFDEFNADANKLLSSLKYSIRANMIQYYKTDQPKIRGWLLDLRSLGVHSLSVKAFPEQVTFILTAPLFREESAGRIETRLRETVTVRLQSKLIIGNTIYLFPSPAESVPLPLPPGIPPAPSLPDLLPVTDTFPNVHTTALLLTPEQYSRIIGFGQGYRGFPQKVSGQYLRMLYFSAGLATASALGDIVPITMKARSFVFLQALMSLVVVGLFLHALAGDIAMGKQNEQKDSSNTTSNNAKQLTG